MLVWGRRPEDKAAKKQRLLSEAEAREKKSESSDKKKPVVVKYGINHITTLVNPLLPAGSLAWAIRIWSGPPCVWTQTVPCCTNLRTCRLSWPRSQS